MVYKCLLKITVQPPPPLTNKNIKLDGNLGLWGVSWDFNFNLCAPDAQCFLDPDSYSPRGDMEGMHFHLVH